MATLQVVRGRWQAGWRRWRGCVMCCPWSGEQEVHSDTSKGDSVPLTLEV